MVYLTVKSPRGDFYREIVQEFKDMAKLLEEEKITALKEAMKDPSRGDVAALVSFYDGAIFQLSQELVSRFSGRAGIADFRYTIDNELTEEEELML